MFDATVESTKVLTPPSLTTSGFVGRALHRSRATLIKSRIRNTSARLPRTLCLCVRNDLLALSLSLLAYPASSQVADWSRQLGETGSHLLYDVAVDPWGSVVITGTSTGSIDFGGGVLSSVGAKDLFIAKFDSAGTHVWSQMFGGHHGLEASHDQLSYNVAVDASGNVIITGYFEGIISFGGASLVSPILGSNVQQDIFVAKFDPDGNHLWSKGLGDTNTWITHNGVAVDGSGNVILVGGFTSAVDFGGGIITSSGALDVYIAKLDPDGNHIWSYGYGDSERQHAFDVTVDAQDNIYVIGQLRGELHFGDPPLVGTQDTYLVKFTPDGVHQWSRSYGAETSSQVQAERVATDSNGNVVIAGYFSANVDFGGGVLRTAGLQDIYVLKLNPAGEHVWSRRFGDSTSQYGWGVAIDAADNVVISGSFYGTLDFGGGPLTSAGVEDIYLATLDPSGNHVWSAAYGDAYAQEGLSVATVGQDIVATGCFQGTVDFGSGPMTAIFEDMYVVRFTDVPTDASLRSGGALSQMSSWPNPTTGTIRISYAVRQSARVALRIYDVRGRLVRTLVNEERDGDNHISWWDGTDQVGQMAPAGLYIVQLRLGDTTSSQRVVLVR